MPVEPPGPPDGDAEALVPEAPEPPVKVSRAAWLEVYNGTWGRPDELVARAEGTVQDGLIELEAVRLPVHVRVNASIPETVVHAWSQGCCATGDATELQDGRGVLHLGPGTWHLEAYGVQDQVHWQDSLELTVRLEWTVNGTVWPAPVDLPGHEAMHEIRLATDAVAANVILRLSTHGEVRDVRLGVQQSGWIQCSDPPRPGDLSTHEVFMEAFVAPESRTARIFLGDVPACQRNGQVPINPDPAHYTLVVSL